MSDLLTIKNIICLIIIMITVVSLYLPHWIIDTSNCKRNWVVIFVILSSLFIIIDKNTLAISMLGILFFAVIIDFANKRQLRNKDERIC